MSRTVLVVNQEADVSTVWERALSAQYTAPVDRVIEQGIAARKIYGERDEYDKKRKIKLARMRVCV